MYRKSRYSQSMRNERRRIEEIFETNVFTSEFPFSLNISDTTGNEDITFAGTKRFSYRYRFKISVSKCLYSRIRDISESWNFNSI